MREYDGTLPKKIYVKHLLKEWNFFFVSSYVFAPKLEAFLDWLNSIKESEFLLPTKLRSLRAPNHARIPKVHWYKEECLVVLTDVLEEYLQSLQDEQPPQLEQPDPEILKEPVVIDTIH